MDMLFEFLAWAMWPLIYVGIYILIGIAGLVRYLAVTGEELGPFGSSAFFVVLWFWFRKSIIWPDSYNLTH